MSIPVADAINRNTSSAISARKRMRLSENAIVAERGRESSSVTSLSHMDFSLDTDPGDVCLITDDIDASAEFLLHSLVHRSVGAQRPCILVDFSRDVRQWEAIAAKRHVRLRENLWKYIDGSSCTLSATEKTAMAAAQSGIPCPQLFPSGQPPTMRSLFDLIVEQATQLNSIIIINQISVLSWMGMPEIDLTRFVRALRAYAAEASGLLDETWHT
jgi:hypothetical protein